MSENDDTSTPDDLAERVAEAAAGTGTRIAVAESLTCGRLAHTLGGTEGASDWFLGGATVYRMESKHAVLGVDEDLDPCVAECAEQLARGVLGLYRADLAVSVTGVGGPDPEDGHAPGTVYLGWAVPDAGDDGGPAVGHRLLHLSGDPDDVLDGSVAAALSTLAEHLNARA